MSKRRTQEGSRTPREIWIVGSPQAGDVSRIQSPEQSSRGGGTASGPYTENSRRFVPPALPTELPAHSRNIRDVDERSQVSSISLRLPSGPTAVEMTPTIPRPQVLVTRATDDSFIRGHGYEQEERHTSELPLQNIVSIYNVRDPIVDRGQSVGSMSSRFKALPSTPGWSEGPYSDVEYRDSSPQLHSQPSTSVLTPLRQKPEPPARKPNLYVSEQHPQQSHQSWLRRLANAIHLLHKPYFLDDKLMSRLGTERKPTRAATWRHYFRLDENKYRPAVPRVYREANYWYKEPNEDGKLWTHRDIMERETSGQFIVECYVSPYDGKRKELIVQATDDILDMGVECQSAWSRTFIRSATPRMIGLSQWAYPEAQSASGKYTAGEIVSIVLKWIPSTLIISYFMVAPDYAIGTDRNNGRYDALQYYWWSYPRAAINTREIPRSILAASEHRETDAGTTTVTPRRLQPRFLMFRDHIALATARDRIPKHSRFRRSYASAPDAAELRPDPYPDVEYSPNDNLYPIRPEFDQTGRATSEDTLWSEKRSFEDYCHYPEQSYVFVSFCNDHFPNLDDMMSKDAQMLADIGVRAARRRDVPAYWLCSSCMPFTTVAEMEKDVAQLNDVVRSADSLAIVVRLQASEGETMEEQLRAALRYYGRRMWTLPEVLLLRQGTKIMIYAISDRPLFDAPNTREPILKTKLELVQIAYEDSLDARQLVDHFEGTLILEPLELISLGLKLLGDREAGKNALEADKVYALMGFMRRRPPINRSDLPFAAFVRLSMANHSEMMLERMACILPRDRKQDIFDLRDAFGCSLWDIYPSCQVAGLGVSDTIILDGAHAASIRWKSFAEIAHIHAETFTRFWIRTLFIYSPWSWYLGTILTAIGQSRDSRRVMILGAILLGIGIVPTLFSPWLMKTFYTGKLWYTQPWIFGFEGYMDIRSLEHLLFGIRGSHLHWSAAGSPLSRVSADSRGYCSGEDPSTDPIVRAKILAARRAKLNETRIFTLVDTHTRTVTLFEAVRPPTALVIAASEGGMQRALLCSLDWRTQTLVRETVIRVETTSLSKMDRVGRLQLSLTSPDYSAERAEV